MSATTPDHITHHGDNTPGQLDLSRPSGKRTIKSGCASTFMIVATVLAVIPLAWLLFAAVRREEQPGQWDNSQYGGHDHEC